MANLVDLRAACRAALACALCSLPFAGAAAQSSERQGGVTILRGQGASPTDAVPQNPAARTPPRGGPPQAPAPRTAPSAGPTAPVGDPGATLAPKVAVSLDSVLGAGPPLAASDAKALADALKAADEQRWADARQLAPRAASAALGKLVDWLNYRSPQGDGTFAQIAAFLKANPDWPDEPILRRQAEDRIKPDTPPADVAEFFRDGAPQTSAGLMRRLAAAERAAPSSLAAIARESWRIGTFRAADEAQFLARYGQHLAPSDTADRFDRLIREGKPEVARDLVRLLPADQRPTAEARLALAARTPEAVALLRALPAERQVDGRILLERVRYLRRLGDPAGARELLRSAPTAGETDEELWVERNVLARESLLAGRAEEAYALLERHGLSRGASFAEAEFLAGWVALRYLQRPGVAAAHFRRLHDGVSLPISRARGAYWLGRAHEASGDRAEALAWYDRSAQHGQTFYGQLAARKIPGGTARMPTDPSASEADRRAVEDREAVAIVRHLRQIDRADIARPFVLRLARAAQSGGEIGLTARLAIELGRPDLAVGIARRAAEAGTVLHQMSYPVVDLGPTGPVERALALALARQESSFYSGAVSPAGAAGLMQLMPGTAQMMAQKLGLPYDPSRLTSDPAYNVALGSQYLSDMLQRFGGSYELALAAYNAGPANVQRWLQSAGDPRSGKIDLLDWIELIPFRETRNYVQRVMEGVAVYRERLSGPFETVGPALRR